jgi:hypothetical protein
MRTPQSSRDKKLARSLLIAQAGKEGATAQHADEKSDTKMPPPEHDDDRCEEPLIVAQEAP